VAAAPEVDVEPSFDLPAAPSFDLPEPTPAPAPVAAAAPAEDFSLDLPELDFSNMEVQKPEVSKFEAPLPVEDFNEGVDDLAVFGDDAVATKLDLARAYIDMGDPDGARSMLEEVLAEGTAAQQGEAQRLMESLR
jgi:pilus assembly protein FimV